MNALPASKVPLKIFLLEPIINDMNEDELIDGSVLEDQLADKRRHPRSVFTYPVEFKVFTKKSPHLSFVGYLKDISLGGACLQFEDKYGRFNIDEVNDSKVKISFTILDGEKVSILARIQWIKKFGPRTGSVKIGIEFKDAEGWQLEVVERLIGMKNKDRSMMWNLWDSTVNN